MSESTVTVVDRENPVTFVARQANFGSDLRHPLIGYVIPLSSFMKPCPNVTYSGTGNWGCGPLCPSGRHSPSPSEPWIALVQRGQCSFADKAREAQRLGAKAVVVGGDDPATSGHPDTLVTMYDPGESIILDVWAQFSSEQ
jgi:E3 ubiquitin-protein ligase RNF13